MCSSALALYLRTTDVAHNASIDVNKEEAEWDLQDSGSGSLSEGLCGLGELRWFEGPFLPLPPPTGSQLDLSADPPPLTPWVNFYQTHEKAVGMESLAAPISTAPMLSPPSPGPDPQQSDTVTGLRDHEILQAAFMQLMMRNFPSNDVLTVDPLAINTLARVPVPVTWDDPEVPEASPVKSSSSSSTPSFPSPIFSEGNATDSGYESYTPPRPSTSRRSASTRAKRSTQRVARRRTPYPSPSLTASSSLGASSSSSSLPSSPEPAKLAAAQLRVSRRRNAQVSVPVTSSGSSTVSLRLSASDYATKTCPHCCKRFPRMGKAELRRHFKCHKGAKNVWDWVCTGVPIELATSRYEVSEDRVAQFVEQGRTMWVGDRLMVGGCCKSMSRADALKRHLRKRKGKCVGDHRGDWQVGMQKKRDEKE